MLGEAEMIIVAVPTPVDEAHIPDFRPLVGASTSVGRHMKKGAIVIYESTVYPGATEEVCIPVLERESGLKWKQDFFVGYSPERINPGDKEHTLTKILKIVSGDSPETLDRVAKLYEKIIVPGVHRASSIKAAEAAKVIENTQRDLNIALMNELAIIFDKIGIDTTEVLEAAGTKWNFLQVQARPGGRPLHRRRPVLPDAQGRHDRLPPAGDPGRPAHQRRHGQVHRRADHQAHDRLGQLHQGRQGQRARPHVQGKLRRPAQQQGHRHHPRAAELRRRGPRAPTRRPRPTRRCTNTASSSNPGTSCRAPMRSSPRWRTASSSALSVEDLGRKLVKGGAFVDVKACYDTAAIQGAGFRLWRL